MNDQYDGSKLEMNSKSSLIESLTLIAKQSGSIGVIFFTSLVASFFISTQMPKKYKAFSVVVSSISPAVVKQFGESGDLANIQETLKKDQVSSLYLNILRKFDIAERVNRKVSERSVEQIQANTKIETFPQSLQFKISVMDKDPKIAARIATVYPEEVNTYFFESFLQPLKTKEEKIKIRIRENEESIERIKEKIKEIKAKYHILSSLKKEKYNLIDKRNVLTNLLQESRIQHKEAASKIVFLEQQLSKEKPMQISSESVTTNPVIKDFRTTLSSLQIKLEGASSIYAEEHPKVIKLKSEYQQAKKNLEKEVDKVLQSQTRTINPLYEKFRGLLITNLVLHKSTSIRLKELEANLQELEHKLTILSGVEKELNILNKQSAGYGEALNKTGLELEQLNVQLPLEKRTFKVESKAAIPQRPYYPDPYLIMIISGVLSLLVSLCYVLFRISYYKSRVGPVSGIKLLALQKPTAQIGWQFVEIAIKLGYLSGRKVEQAMKLLQTYNVVSTKPKLLHPTNKL
jgi:uncharacterized protein involved in exopolysaccharide biosynthesis